MAKLDLTGLMTGLPTDQELRTQGQARAAQIQGGGLGSNLARGIASRAPQREEMMRQGLGGMFGVDTRTGDQQQKARMQQALSGLKLDTPEGLMQLAKIHQATGNTDAALKAITAARALESASIASATEQQRRDEDFGLEKRKVAVLERKGGTPSRTEVITTNIGGVDKQALINLDDGSVIAQFNSSSDVVSDSANTFEKKVRNAEGELEWVSYRRQKDGPPLKIAVLGPAENVVLTDKELLKVESVGEDGQSYLTVYDLNSTDRTPLFKALTDTNRVLTEKIDADTGQTVKISTLPDGTGGVSYGVTKLPTFDIVQNDNGTYNVINETLGKLVLENVATEASAKALVKERTDIQKTLTEIDRQIGFISEADDLVANNSARWDAANYATLYPLMKFVGGSTAKQLEAKNESIISAIGMDKLVDLKDSSSVGASGLGALNVKELQMLQDALGRLDPSVGDVAYRKQLAEVKRHYGNFRSTLMGQTPPIDWSNPAYSDFTKTVTVNGQPRTYYKLSNSSGQPLTTADGSIQWFPAPAGQPARK
tara:strand:+ start:1896 stop:3518 length:1623 start_codon:yes stop_codon:yes gene_type:complete